MVFGGLLSEMRALTERTDQQSSVVIKTLMQIKHLQGLHVRKGSEINMLERGIKRAVVINRNKGINDVISSLLDNPFCDREEVLSLQHKLYHSVMTIEIGALKRELTQISEKMARERRILKSITTEKVFKMCVEFLTFHNASETVHSGKNNELIWKAALEDKELQANSIDRWLKLVTSIATEYRYDKKCEKQTLTTTEIERIEIPPEDT